MDRRNFLKLSLSAPFAATFVRSEPESTVVKSERGFRTLTGLLLLDGEDVGAVEVKLEAISLASELDNVFAGGEYVKGLRTYRIFAKCMNVQEVRDIFWKCAEVEFKLFPVEGGDYFYTGKCIGYELSIDIDVLEPKEPAASVLLEATSPVEMCSV